MIRIDFFYYWSNIPCAIIRYKIQLFEYGKCKFILIFQLNINIFVVFYSVLTYNNTFKKFFNNILKVYEIVMNYVKTVIVQRKLLCKRFFFFYVDISRWKIIQFL